MIFKQFEYFKKLLAKFSTFKKHRKDKNSGKMAKRRYNEKEQFYLNGDEVEDCQSHY